MRVICNEKRKLRKEVNDYEVVLLNCISWNLDIIIFKKRIVDRIRNSGIVPDSGEWRRGAQEMLQGLEGFQKQQGLRYL